MTTLDKIYRLRLWRFGEFPIEAFEVVSRTPKTVIIKVYHDTDKTSEGYCENRYNLNSVDFAFFDTLDDATVAAENVIFNRLRYYETQADKLRVRLQEVCEHRAITSPAKGGKCVRCGFEVPNPEEYTCGGG